MDELFPVCVSQQIIYDFPFHSTNDIFSLEF